MTARWKWHGRTLSTQTAGEWHRGTAPDGKTYEVKIDSQSIDGNRSMALCSIRDAYTGEVIAALAANEGGITRAHRWACDFARRSDLRELRADFDCRTSVLVRSAQARSFNDARRKIESALDTMRKQADSLALRAENDTRATRARDRSRAIVDALQTILDDHAVMLNARPLDRL